MKEEGSPKPGSQMSHIRVGPQPLTIAEYRARQGKPLANEAPTPYIPKTTRPKRRGGYTQKLKRERAIIMQQLNMNPPPPWAKATKLWTRITEIEFQIEQFLAAKRQAQK